MNEMFKLEFYINDKLYKNLIIYKPNKHYLLLGDGFTTNPLTIYIHEIDDKFIIYQESVDSKLIGEKTKLKVNKEINSTRSGTSYKGEPITKSIKLKLLPFRYPKDLLKIGYKEDISFIRELLIEEMGNKLEREWMINYLTNKRDYSFIIDIYHQGLYGFEKDEERIIKLTATGVDEFEKWYQTNKDTYDYLRNKIDIYVKSYAYTSKNGFEIFNDFLKAKVKLDSNDDRGVQLLLELASELSELKDIKDLVLLEIGKYGLKNTLKKIVKISKECYAEYLARQEKGDPIKRVMKYHIEEMNDEDTPQVMYDEIVPDGYDEEKVESVLNEYALKGDEIAKGLIEIK